jgi:pectinesterase
MRRTVPSRRGFLLTTAGAGAALGLGLAAGGPAAAGTRPRPRPFGRYGSPAARRTPRTLYVDPYGRGDFTSVQAAVDAAAGDGWTLVLAPGTYRERVSVDTGRTGATWIGASGDPRDVVIVHDTAAGTPKPDGSGTYGTSGSATTTVRADGFTARAVTFAHDWLRADQPDCRFLGHQDTLYADTRDLGVFARQYYERCYVEGDVDFVFGRATAVYDQCHFHTLVRPDLDAAPYGFVFAPSTAGANPRGYLVTGGRVSSEAPDGYYKLARPWVPSSDTTARPMLTVRETHLGAGIDAVAPYANMRDEYPWQEQRFCEYRNTGPGAAVTVPGNRPQLTRAEAAAHTREAYLGDWRPHDRPAHGGRG